MYYAQFHQFHTEGAFLPQEDGVSRKQIQSFRTLRSCISRSFHDNSLKYVKLGCIALRFPAVVIDIFSEDDGDDNDDESEGREACSRSDRQLSMQA